MHAANFLAGLLEARLPRWEVHHVFSLLPSLPLPPSSLARSAMASSSSSRAALRLFKGSSSASRLPLRRCLTSDAARGAEAAGDGGAPDEALTNAIATLSAKAAPKVAPQVDEEARRRALRKTMRE